MKFTKLILIAAAALLVLTGAVAVRAADNPLQGIFDNALTNGAVMGGYWRSTTGNASIANYDLVYNIAKTPEGVLGAGLLFGGDFMWSRNEHVWNDVKGGVAVNATLAPLKQFGLTNFFCRITGGILVATPHESGAGVGSIEFATIDVGVRIWKQLELRIDPGWQNRTGQGARWDRQYLGINGGLSWGF